MTPATNPTNRCTRAIRLTLAHELGRDAFHLDDAQWTEFCRGFALESLERDQLDKAQRRLEELDQLKQPQGWRARLPKWVRWVMGV